MERVEDFARDFQIAAACGIDFSKLDLDLQSGVDRLLAHPKYVSDAHIWMTGSGDSLFAAQAVLPGLERWAGLRGTAVSAIDFARYRTPLLTDRDVLWAISNSGRAARTREAVGLARDKKILTIGVAGSAAGPLASAVDVTMLRQVEELTDIDSGRRGIFLNMVEFLAAMYALYFAGLKLGVARGALTENESDRILRDCKTAIASVGEIAARCEPAAEKLAGELRNLDTIWVIGAGPSFGTARYCAAKFHEQLPWNGIPEDLEEWAHLQYFLTLEWKERSAVFVLAPPGNSLDRAEELVEGIHAVGGRAVVVAHAAHGLFPLANSTFRIDGVDGEFLSAFTYHLPAQILILYLARLRGHEPFALRRADGNRLIRNGVVLTDTGSLA
jgi:glucosamine--fructose-6-phosphate aminotransferase (isomerizing)